MAGWGGRSWRVMALRHAIFLVAVAHSHPCDRDTPSSLKASFPNRLSDIGNPVFGANDTGCTIPTGIQEQKYI